MGVSWVRGVTWVVAMIVGAAYGAAGTIGQSFVWAGIPVGLVIAIIGSTALVLAVRLLTEDRWAAAAAALGAALVTMVLSGQGPGGSVVVPAPPAGEINTGIIWTLAVPLIGALIVAWPNFTTTGAARPASGPDA